MGACVTINLYQLYWNISNYRIDRKLLLLLWHFLPTFFFFFKFFLFDRRAYNVNVLCNQFRLNNRKKMYMERPNGKYRRNAKKILRPQNVKFIQMKIFATFSSRFVFVSFSYLSFVDVVLVAFNVPFSSSFSFFLFFFVFSFRLFVYLRLK